MSRSSLEIKALRQRVSDLEAELAHIKAANTPLPIGTHVRVRHTITGHDKRDNTYELDGDHWYDRDQLEVIKET